MIKQKFEKQKELGIWSADMQLPERLQLDNIMICIEPVCKEIDMLYSEKRKQSAKLAP